MRIHFPLRSRSQAAGRSPELQFIQTGTIHHEFWRQCQTDEFCFLSFCYTHVDQITSFIHASYIMSGRLFLPLMYQSDPICYVTSINVGANGVEARSNQKLSCQLSLLIELAGLNKFILVQCIHHAQARKCRGQCSWWLMAIWRNTQILVNTVCLNLIDFFKTRQMLLVYRSLTLDDQIRFFDEILTSSACSK